MSLLTRVSYTVGHSVLAVQSLAGELPTVPLPIAADRRLLARLASERAIPLRQLADVAIALAELEADPAPENAGKRLVSVVGQR